LICLPEHKQWNSRPTIVAVSWGYQKSEEIVCLFNLSS